VNESTKVQCHAMISKTSANMKLNAALGDNGCLTVMLHNRLLYLLNLY